MDYMGDTSVALLDSQPSQVEVVVDDDEEGRKRKQRKSKPTLNCGECVERKTKCNRIRPSCTSCIRRQTTCLYHGNANNPVAASSKTVQQNRGRSIRKSTKPTTAKVSLIYDFPRTIRPDRNDSCQQHASPREKPALFNLSGMSSHHPFHNYWTSAGGPAEVISVLPTKDTADSLIQKYFQCVDPLYPVLIQSEFKAQHERFWTLSLEEKCDYNAAQLALQFVVYALGTQYMDNLPPEKRVHMADFYLSASHQSLCLFSYLNRCSLATIQTMILICYVLIGKGFTSDAWTFSGIIQRQAYGLELNRRPGMLGVSPDLREEQLRYRLWQAVMFQDTNLSMYLELPPSTLFYDLQPTCLKRLDIENINGTATKSLPDELSSTNDIRYLRSMWEYASFTQVHVCVPRCRGQSLCISSDHKTQLISHLRDMYHHWEEPFNSYDPSRFEISDQRLVRQLIAVSSNYFHVLTIICMYEDAKLGVYCAVYGALAAAHEGMSSFFALARFCPGQVDSWGAYHTRAFLQVTMIGKILVAQNGKSKAQHRDTQLLLARSDFDHYLDILAQVRGSSSFETTRIQRLEDLRRLREKWTVERHVHGE